MNVSIVSLYKAVFTDFVKYMKQYAGFFTLKAFLGTLCYVLLYSVTSRAYFFEIITDRSYFIQHLFSFIRSHGQSGDITTLGIFMLLYLLSFLCYVVILNFIYSTQIKKVAGSIKDFLSAFSCKAVRKVFYVQLMALFVAGAILFLLASIWAAGYLILKDMQIVRMMRLLWMALFVMIASVSLFIVFTEYFLAPFIVFEEKGLTTEMALTESRRRTKKQRFKVGIMLLFTILLLLLFHTVAASVLLFPLLLQKGSSLVPGLIFFSLQSLVLGQSFFYQSHIVVTFVLLFVLQWYRFFILTFFLILNGEIYKRLSLETNPGNSAY